MAIELQTKYITLNDFKVFWGIDLEQRLNSDDNPSNDALAFLMRVEIDVAAYINSNFYRNIDMEYPEFSDFQKEHYKLALLMQSKYLFDNGDIGSDSGYDINSGMKISREHLQAIQISDKARQHLMLCGLWCRHIKGNRGGFGFYG